MRWAKSKMKGFAAYISAGDLLGRTSIVVNSAFAHLASGLVVGSCFIALGVFVERCFGPRPRERTDTPLNLRYFAAASVLQASMVPALVGLTAAAVSRMGGGLIVTPQRGWDSILCITGYVVAMDLGEYLFHRAQHLFPFLWSMHSLHHSDRTLNVSTTIRHFWFEHLLKVVTIYLAIALLFRACLLSVTVYALLSIYNYLTHANVRLGLGRWSWVLNSPQYHRLHHSSLPEHFDCNFAALFPVFDLVFGSYRRPRRGEYPPTGLLCRKAPDKLTEALMWPFGV